MANTDIYTMTLGMNVLNHLGINLYSNVPAVLAEVVANAWDADAKTVVITVDPDADRITIQDDGVGMSFDDLNSRYLRVGYKRRLQTNGAVTPKFQRHVMGRKGIGKLSLFSIARQITVQSIKDGEKHALLMDLDEVQKIIDETEKIIDETAQTPYHPQALDSSAVDFERGTRIVLTRLTKTIGSDQILALRKRLACRFCIIGEEYAFSVVVNDTPITPSDRGYLEKLQYVWFYGNVNASYKSSCSKTEQVNTRPGKCGDFDVSGWIGTVRNAGDLKGDESDNLNRIVVMVRGKMAEEDLLPRFPEGGIYTKYLVGELHADFLDLDDQTDIAASSRQAMIEGDPRFRALIEFVHIELKHIQSAWTKFRNDKGEEEAAKVPKVKEWLEGLGPDDHKYARSLLGKINQVLAPNDAYKKTMYAHAILAFENMRYRNRLSELESVSLENVDALTSVFASLDDIEATLYYQIVKERIQTIDKLNEKVESAAVEKVVQKYLFDHLWLLDPSWERATEGFSYIEKTVAKAFEKENIVWGEDEKTGRIDIWYATTSGTHVIVELKKSDRVVTTFELEEQISKYRNALRHALTETNHANEPISIICLLGRTPSDWEDSFDSQAIGRANLERYNAKVMFYKELIGNAYKAYQQYMDKHEKVGRLLGIYNALAAGEDDAGNQGVSSDRPCLVDTCSVPAPASTGTIVAEEGTR